MPRYLSKSFVKSLVILMVVCFAIVAWQILLKNITKTSTEFDFNAVSQDLIETTKEHSPDIAVAKLREMTEDNKAVLKECHSLIHEIGRATYDRFQDFEVAIKYQTEFCNSGFIHGVIESKFKSSQDITQSMLEVCNSQNKSRFESWQCYHGIGHGLMYFTGNDLPQSIAYCSYFSDDFAQRNCINGVFMENFNTDQKTHPSRYLKADNPFYPCESQSDQNKGICYNYAPIFYLKLHPKDYSGNLKLCSSLPDEYKKWCTSGVGGQAIKENMSDSKLVETICMEAEASLIPTCIGAMVSTIVSHYGSTEQALSICPELEIANQAACQKAIETKESDFIQI